MLDIINIIIITVYSLDILLLFLFGLHAYGMVVLYRKNSRFCQSGSEQGYQPIDLSVSREKDLPMVTVQLPIYNEFYVVDRLLKGVADLKWPLSRLEIQVLDDSTDETRDKIARLVAFYKQRKLNIIHVHRENREGHKAGALKAGLAQAKGQYIAVFDADFVPAPDFLLRTIPYFQEADVGMVQTRWGHINADYSMLTRAQSLGIDGHFMIEQVARNCNNLWMNFNGTGGIWRRECILEAGNWQSDTLTEDFDLSYRAELAGWRFRYLMDVVNPAELPATIAAFKSQQFRWCKGSIQTAVKLIPRILRSRFSPSIKTEAIVHLLNYSVHPLMMINILLALPLLMMDTWSGWSIYDLSMMVLFGAAAFLSLGTFGPAFFYIYSQRELYSDWFRRIIWLPVLMMIGTGIAINNTRAFLEAILGIQSAFKRTPKYRIENKKDRLAERMRYKLPFDRLIVLEFFMGCYCLLCVIVSIWYERLFIMPFMLLYAAGFFYIGIKGILESVSSVTAFKLAGQEN